jgi:3-(3-hydroxy-phenyl)propionate hydroxylase
MDAEYSVAIVGAGPTGLTIANLLGAAGVSVILLEGNASTVAEPRAVSIDDESLRVIQAMGLLDAVQQEIVSGYGSEYFGPSGNLFLKVRPLGQPYGHPRRNAFRQPVLEAQLKAGLARFPSIDCRFSTTVERCAQDETGVTLQTVDGRRRIRPVRAAYVVACDGARSTMREQLGLTLEGSSLDERWLIIDLENSPAVSTETIVSCNSRRPAIALPGPRLTRRYEFKLLLHESDQEMLSETRVSELLTSHGAAESSQIIRKTVYHFHARVADRWGKDRVWLAGDSAHLMPPFAGQGMNSGIRDAANIAWKLSEVIKGRLGPALLQTYESERRHHVTQMIRLALRMGSIMGPPSRLNGFLTRAFFKALGAWPAARNYFAEMKYKPVPRFDRGFLVKSSLVERGLVGRMIPQPRLKTTDHARPQLLDEIMGEGFVLLGIDVGPVSVDLLSLGPTWDDILSKRLALTSAQAPEFSELSGKYLLVRPDRYVMACFSDDERLHIVELLEDLWTKTWRGKAV